MSSNWTRYRLEELGNIVTGKTPPSKVQDAFSVSGVQFVTPRDMDGRRWIDRTERYLSESGVTAVKKSLVPSNSVAVSCIGSDMGKAVLLSCESVTNQQINTIVVDTENFNPVFIYYVLSTQQDALKSIAGGSATPILNKGHFGKFEIELPTKDEQDRLVEYLDCLDSKFEINTQTNQALEQIAQAIFKSWFVDFDPVKAKIEALAAGGSADDAELAAMGVISAKTLDELNSLKANNPEAFNKLAQTAALFPAAMQDSELGEIPEGWEVKPFKKIIDKYVDNRGKTPPIVESGIPLVEVKHLPENSAFPNLNTEKRVTEETYKTWFRVHVEPKDILISTVGTIGRTSFVKSTNFGIAQNVLGLRFAKAVEPEYMFYTIKAHRFQHDMTARLVTTVQSSIKRKDLDTIDILVPTPSIQIAFCEFVEPLLDEQFVNNTQNSDLAIIRDTLLPKLLSDEINLITSEVEA